MQTVARRIAQIVEAYSGEGGKPRWAGGSSPQRSHNDAMDCIDPSCCERCKENPRGTGPGQRLAWET